MALLTDGCAKSADADSVASHDRELALTVLVEVGHVHRLSIFFAKLEDITDLNTFFNLNVRLSAFRTNRAGKCLCDIMIGDFANVTFDIHALEVCVFFVCTANE